jgi:hypothetical protein
MPQDLQFLMPLPMPALTRLHASDTLLSLYCSTNCS